MGQTSTLWFAGAEPNGPVVIWAGTSKRTWFGAPLLPLALAAIGAPGCSLLAEPLIVAGLVADGSGNAFLPVLLPGVGPTSSLIFFTQGAAFVPGSNNVQAVFSQGIALKIQ